jgi:hypothetical protein
LQKLKTSVKKEMHVTYTNYVSNLIEPPTDENGHKNKQKRFWSYIRSIGKDNSGIPPLKDKSKGVLMSDPTAKAGILNKQYQSAFTVEDTTNTPTMGDHQLPDIPDPIISVPGIAKLLTKLKPHKATGPDEIPARFLQDNADQIAPIRHIIFQKSLEEGEVPPTGKLQTSSLFSKKAINMTQQTIDQCP